MSSSASDVNGSSSSRGYTRNHLQFTHEVERFQRKASGSLACGPVTFKVILVRPNAKGSKIVLQAIDAVCGHLVCIHLQFLTFLVGSLC